MPLVNYCIMAETSLSRTYEKKCLELIKKGHMPSLARYYARRHAFIAERRKNVNKMELSKQKNGSP